MQRIAVFPGSFDPVTRGHESVVLRAMPLFDRIIIAVGENAGKKPFFPLEKRLEWLSAVFGSVEGAEVTTYSGLTIDFCRSGGAGFILRGLRTSADFEFERGIGQMNRAMMPGVETVFFLCSPEYSMISSSVVRDVIRNGGDARPFVPQAVAGDPLFFTGKH